MPTMVDQNLLCKESPISSSGPLQEFGDDYRLIKFA